MDFQKRMRHVSFHDSVPSWCNARPPSSPPTFTMAYVQVEADDVCHDSIILMRTSNPFLEARGRPRRPPVQM